MYHEQSQLTGRVAVRGGTARRAPRERERERETGTRERQRSFRDAASSNEIDSARVERAPRRSPRRRAPSGAARVVHSSLLFHDTPLHHARLADRGGERRLALLVRRAARDDRGGAQVAAAAAARQHAGRPGAERLAGGDVYIYIHNTYTHTHTHWARRSRGASGARSAGDRTFRFGAAETKGKNEVGRRRDGRASGVHTIEGERALLRWVGPPTGPQEVPPPETTFLFGADFVFLSLNNFSFSGVDKNWAIFMEHIIK